MALKRYYLLLLCLICCLVAALLISRRIDRSLPLEPTSEASEQRSTKQDELEERTYTLIDLAESGKTFAYSKLSMRLKVPSSSPRFVQRPNFLQPGFQEPTSEEHMSPKYVLSRAMLDATGEPDLPTLAETSSSPSQSITAPADKPIRFNPLELDIKPTGSRPAADEAISELLFQRPSVSKNFTGRHKRQTGEEPSERSLLAESFKEPLELAATELNVRAQSINVTFLDCFLVDTDKRYEQQIMFEDKYRKVASTRRVPAATMMAIISSCRSLTWASLASLASPAQSPWAEARVARNASTSGPELSLDPPASSLGKAPVQDFLGSLLSNWLPAGQGAPGEGPTARALASRMRSASSARQADPQASYLNMGLSMVSGIVPNTLWCGLGDRASNYSQLGAEHRVDSCCRAHDHCPIRLKAFNTDYGLVNWSVSTRSHCDCDLDFNDCLQAINSTLSNVIRVLYFRFVGVQCIDEDGRERSPGVLPTSTLTAPAVR